MDRQDLIIKPKIFVCSPLRAVHPDKTINLEGIAKNIQKAGEYCRLVMLTGEFRAFAPHVFYTRFLDEAEESERELGITAGFDDLAESAELWHFTHMVSPGMEREMFKCTEWGIPILCGETELLRRGVVLPDWMHQDAQYHHTAWPSP